MRFGLVFVIYIVVGVLVAAGIIGDEGSYFKDLDNIEGIVEMLLAVFLWPLLLLGVSLEIGDGSVSGGDGGGSGGNPGGNGDGAAPGGSGSGN